MYLSQIIPETCSFIGADRNCVHHRSSQILVLLSVPIENVFITDICFFS